MSDNASTAATASSTTTEASQITKTSVVGRWADEPDDVVEEPEATSTSSATDGIILDSLAIDESKKVNNFLDDPEDANIQAVKQTHSLIFIFSFI